MSTPADTSTIYQNVTDRYTATALAPSLPNHSHAVAQAFGYTAEDLASIPADSNLGLSCGNPLALAHLQPGETIIDLGSGAGFDCLLAANKVGDKGRVIGVDMNDSMLAKARRNAAKAGTENIVSFVRSRITDIALPSATADVVISNCVINLVPHTEKHCVFKEMYRLLRPGGRVAVSDILLKKELDERMREDVVLYVGCVAGAARKEDYEGWLREAGFRDVLVVDTKADLNVYTRTEEGESVEGGCCGPAEKNGDDRDGGCCKPNKVEVKRATSACCGPNEADGGVVQDVRTNFKDVDLNEWAGSYKIFAVKAE